MYLNLPHSKIITYSLGILTLFISSCGSYQQASYYDDDGIYGNGNRTVSVEKRNYQGVRNQQVETDTYGQYFGEKANEYDEFLDSEIFTDVDDYYGEEPIDSVGVNIPEEYYLENSYNENAGWGDNPSSVQINIYDNTPNFRF